MNLQAMYEEVLRELIESWKNQYNWGWFGKKDQANKTFQGYVQKGILSQAGYKEITGEDYNETSLNKS